MLRRLISFALACALLLALLPAAVAHAQDDAGDEEETVEPSYYGDSELIETLRGYGLLDEWISASPVSRQASVLAVSSGAYQTRRQAFLASLDSWAARTEAVRRDQARIDATQAEVDLVRSALVGVRDALVVDDRLKAADSETLATIAGALDSLATVVPPEPDDGTADDPLSQAEVDLASLAERAQIELRELNDWDAAVTRSGVTAFVGFDMLQADLRSVEQLLERGREQLRPAQQRSERLRTSTLEQIPGLHSARMLGSTDVNGISVVTVDAYIRAAAGVSCPVDWALLAGIGSIESKHGRLGGASVSSSGQVSPAIFGPLLDGGETTRGSRAVDDQVDEQEAEGDTRREVATELAAPSDLVDSWWYSFRSRIAPESLEITGASDVEEEGNGFAVIIDSDGGRLDGNDKWDRAVGPMQFLPETWSRWATDGNGDGVSDPHNLYDAAAAAARFLCYLRETRGSSPSTYVLGYNESRSYVRSVLSTAAGLRSRLLPE